ncbi:MAG: biotin--[acetyl-CoA-carboxylase] ligase [Flavitalea sp.]
MSPQTPPLPAIGQPFIKLAHVDSTNNYAMGLVHEGMATHGTVVFALHQSAGKGQRGKSWVAEPGQNITLSVILAPPSELQPFILSAIIALSCRELVDFYAKSEVYVKWPNDIYWRDRKAGGILIETLVSGKQLKWSVAGMGININQVSFPDETNRPVSLKQITGKFYDPEELAIELCIIINRRFKNYQASEILAEYNQHLLFKDQKVRLKSGQITFETTIKGVNESGELITFDVCERTFREVTWLMENR